MLNNIGYDTLGHTFFIEDGAERFNQIEGNLGLVTRRTSSLLDTDTTPATFWITNPNNFFRNNAGLLTLCLFFCCFCCFAPFSNGIPVQRLDRIAMDTGLTCPLVPLAPLLGLPATSVPKGSSLGHLTTIAHTPTGATASESSRTCSPVWIRAVAWTHPTWSVPLSLPDPN